MKDAVAKALDTREWWKFLIVCGLPALTATLATNDRNLSLIAAGVVTLGFAEWINHPLQTALMPGSAYFPAGVITSYPRRMSAFGALLDVLAIVLIGWGAYRLI